MFLVSLTTPNNESCEFPYFYGTDTWPSHFCRSTGGNDFTCPTRSGTGVCRLGEILQLIIEIDYSSSVIFLGRYGLITTDRSGSQYHTYTTINTVNTPSNGFQCLDFYYYLTSTTYNAKISVGWSAGLAPRNIVEVNSTGDKWEREQITFESPGQRYYVRKISRRMSRTKQNIIESFSLNLSFGFKQYAIQDPLVSLSPSMKSMCMMVLAVRHHQRRLPFEINFL